MNEIEAIFCKLLKCDRSRLYLDRYRLPLEKRQYDRFQKILKRRLGGEPLQYLIGDAEFMGLRFRVKPGVLIPRPETEILVEETLKKISSLDKASFCVLDMGTGSGNIAISLARFLKHAKIYAADISLACLSVAVSNARLNRVQKRVKFLQSDLFACFQDKKISFDVIVSNPPYIAPSQYEDLPEDVLQEPALALVAQEDGLYFYSQIQRGAREHLKPHGFIFLEIAEGQAAGIKKIFSDRSVWKEISFVKDYNGIERVVIIKRT